jgi:aryl-alcohol dehydrogenase-like predicted oxidoreductase
MDRMRRTVLSAGAGLLAMSALGARANPTMLTRAIPRSGEQLPAVGIGTWQAFDIGTQGAEADQATEALQRFIDLGGRVIDSSPMYGRAETAVGALSRAAGLNDALFIATKIWTRGAAEGRAQLDESLRKLERKTLDLVQVHNLLDVEAHLATLRAARDAGQVRYIGLTHHQAHAHDELERRMRAPGVDFIQINYSVLEPEAGARLLPAAAEHGVAVLINRPFAKGALIERVRDKPLPPVAAALGCTSAAQLLLKWILANPAVTCVLVGTRKAHHVADNLAAASEPLPDAAQRAAIAAWLSAA